MYIYGPDHELNELSLVKWGASLYRASRLAIVKYIIIQLCMGGIIKKDIIRIAVNKVRVYYMEWTMVAIGIFDAVTRSYRGIFMVDANIIAWDTRVAIKCLLIDANFIVSGLSTQNQGLC